MRMIRSAIMATVLGVASASFTFAQKPAGPAPKVAEKTARATALARIPNGVVKSEELENEGGHLIYSYDIKVPGKPGIDEVNIDAMTGKILNVAHEGKAAEAREATQDAKDAAAKKH